MRLNTMVNRLKQTIYAIYMLMQLPWMLSSSWEFKTMAIKGAIRDSDMAHELNIQYLYESCTSHFHPRFSQNA